MVAPKTVRTTTTSKRGGGRGKVTRTTTTTTKAPKAQARARPAAPRTPPRSVPSPLIQRAIATEVTRNEALSKYMYGFTDPAFPGRGPPRDTRPTILGTYELMQEVEVSAFNATWTPQFPTTDSGSSNFVAPYMLDASGRIAVVICPQCPLVNNSNGGDGINPFQFISGITFSPADNFASIAGMGTDSTCGAKPYLLEQFPYGVPTCPQPSAYYPNVPANWRCVGLRTVLTVTTPAMTASGSVRAGDNRDFQGAPIDNVQLYEGGTEAASLSNVQATYSSLLDVGQSVRKVGSFSNGAQYESVWLPTNDSALQYWNAVDSLSWVRLSATNQPYVPNHVLANNMINSAANVFILEGLQPGFTFTLQTTFSVEMVATMNSTLALFLHNGRLASHFLPEWSLLASMNAGGQPGAAVSCMLECNCGCRGFQQAVQGISAPGTLPYKASQGGPTSSTQVVAHVAQAGHRPSVLQSPENALQHITRGITKASDFARSLKGGVDKVMGWVGNAAKIGAAVSDLVGYGEAAMAFL